ncbi:7505_t:CDS:2 [Paraglomus brasilianum]|uniref:7505_t:CDS:1 n=1 Tax=Paraglomus brasilianum TaxID=144538 RepID=A0A9N8VST7_9GLOM|nr:7505_t:CDS:2 [Paraglomus brasilianum]
MNSDEELYEETLRYENEIYRDPLDHEISDSNLSEGRLSDEETEKLLSCVYYTSGPVSISPPQPKRQKLSTVTEDTPSSTSTLSRLSLTDTSSLSTLQNSSPSPLLNTPSKITTFGSSFETPSRTSSASQSSISIRSQTQTQSASSHSSYYILKTSSSSSSSPSSPPRTNPTNLNFSDIEESKYGINHAHVRMQLPNRNKDDRDIITLEDDEDWANGEVHLISATNTTTSTDAVDLSEEFGGPPVRKSNRYFMLNHCPLCKQLGHLKINCSRNRKINQSAVRSANKLEDVWRKYKYEVDCDFGKNVRSFCYTCGVRGHFGDECKSTSTGYSAFSKSHITKAEKHIMGLREKSKEEIVG